jgi:hypothetical protein
MPWISSIFAMFAMNKMPLLQGSSLLLSLVGQLVPLAIIVHRQPRPQPRTNNLLVSTIHLSVKIYFT